jgi:hypothetical protein
MQIADWLTVCLTELKKDEGARDHGHGVGLTKLDTSHYEPDEAMGGAVCDETAPLD